MEAHVTVWLEDRAYRFFPGATVRDLIGRLSEPMRDAISRGDVLITDRDGYEVAPGGALSPDAVYLLIHPRRGT